MKYKQLRSNLNNGEKNAWTHERPGTAVAHCQCLHPADCQLPALSNRQHSNSSSKICTELPCNRTAGPIPGKLPGDTTIARATLQRPAQRCALETLLSCRPELIGPMASDR